MGYTLSWSGKLPSTAEWLLIIGFIIGALGLFLHTFTLTTEQGSIVLFVVGVLTLLAKTITSTSA
jgi:hypothetical protein